jgi:hypothetical protein
MSRKPTLVLVAQLAVAGCSGSAAPTGSPLPAATASTSGIAGASQTPVVFASAQYPYSISLPIGWTGTAARAAWDGTGAPTIDDPAMDVFGPAGNGTAFGAAAKTTSSLATWVADGIATNFQVHSDTCPQTPGMDEPVTIGGQPGTLVGWNCGILINTAFTVVNGYGYRFAFRDPAVAAATDPADKATFTTMLGSIVFR